MEAGGKGGDTTQLTKGQQDSWDNNAEDCSVCLTTFDDTLRRPRNLPCGHTFCTPCINRVKEQGQITCPACRVKHAFSEAGQFPINYALEAFMKSVRESSQNEVAGFSRQIRSTLQEQMAKILAAIHTCQERQAQLSQYHTTLMDWGERQQNLEDRLQTLMDESKGAKVMVRQEESKVAEKKEQEQQWQQQLHTLLQILYRVTTEQEVGVASVDVARCSDEERQRAKECRVMFPNVHTVTTINKVREASSAALEAAKTVQVAHEKVNAPVGAAGDSSLSPSPNSSITDRLNALLTPPLKVQDLRTMTHPARSLLQAGRVFAIHQKEGRSRHARISLEDGRLYLHSLQDQPLPPRAVTLQVDEVLPAAPPCLVFLDLTWPGIAPRRVFVRLSPDTQRGRQFLLLCTGQRGPCYANTRLLKVIDKGRPGESVFGGDYQNNNGTGGAALLPALDESKYRESWRAGAVWGSSWFGPAQGAQFRITTRNWQGTGAPCVFGKVVSGLEVVEAAAQHSPITEVSVVDCGVVLWDQKSLQMK